MTKEEFAALITGREYGRDITREQHKIAKGADLVIINGNSDDGIVASGAIDDEMGIWGTTKVYMTTDGFLEKGAAGGLVEIVAEWSPTGLDTSWLISTAIPFAPFDIMEDGALFCRGIVIDLKDIGV